MQVPAQHFWADEQQALVGVPQGVVPAAQDKAAAAPGIATE
jgi:hypothetical protein